LWGCSVVLSTFTLTISLPLLNGYAKQCSSTSWPFGEGNWKANTYIFRITNCSHLSNHCTYIKFLKSFWCYLLHTWKVKICLIQYIGNMHVKKYLIVNGFAKTNQKCHNCNKNWNLFNSIATLRHYPDTVTKSHRWMTRSAFLDRFFRSCKAMKGQHSSWGTAEGHQ